jgi:hydrogenase maturation protease
MNATTLVIGLGNPILGDDGVGWRVAEQVSERLHDSDVDVICLSLGGLALMEYLAGYRRAIIIDAVSSGAMPGSLYRKTAREMDGLGVRHTASVHDMSLCSALALGRELGIDVPEEIQVVGVEAEPDFDFGEELSAPVAAAIPAAILAVMDLLGSDDRQGISATQAKTFLVTSAY